MIGETVPESLSALRNWVLDAFDLSGNAVGIIGDEAHLSGYHRSRDWILTDPRSENKRLDYSVTHMFDQMGPGSAVAAMDISLDRKRMIEVTGRLMRAMRDQDPRVSNLREFYGTLDGDNVTGWDARYGRTVSSDDSHLWHIHLSFWRGRAGNDHSGVLAVLTGEEIDMDEVQDLRLKLIFDNWAPTEEEWVQKGGSRAVYRAAVARGGAMNMNALAHKNSQLLIEGLQADNKALRNSVTILATAVGSLVQKVDSLHQKVDALGASSGADPQALAKGVVAELGKAITT